MDFRKDIHEQINEVLKDIRKSNKKAKRSNIVCIITYFVVVLLFGYKMVALGPTYEDIVLIFTLITIFIVLRQIVVSKKEDINKKAYSLSILNIYLLMLNNLNIDNKDKQLFIEIINKNEK